MWPQHLSTRWFSLDMGQDLHAGLFPYSSPHPLHLPHHSSRILSLMSPQHHHLHHDSHLTLTKPAAAAAPSKVNQKSVRDQHQILQHPTTTVHTTTHNSLQSVCHLLVNSPHVNYLVVSVWFGRKESGAKQTSWRPCFVSQLHIS